MNRFVSVPYIIAAGVIVFAMGGFAVWKIADSNGHTDGAYTIEARPLQRLVTFSGTVVPKQRVELAFEKAGRVTTVSADVGDRVSRGQTLAALSLSDSDAAISREKANLIAAEAHLDAQRRGARPEEIAVEKAQLESARVTATEAREALITALSTSYNTADTSVYQTADQLFENPRTIPRLKYRSRDSALDNQLQTSRIEVEKMLEAWRDDLATLLQAAGRDSSSLTRNRSGITSPALAARAVAAAALSTTAQDPASPATSVDATRERLQDTRVFLDSSITYVSGLTAGGNLTQETIDAWFAALTTARSNILSQLASLNTAYKAFVTAGEDIKVAEARLALMEAGTSAEGIREEEGMVAAQRARVDELMSDREKYLLRSPFAGTITNRAIEPGELATIGVPVMTLDGDDAFEIDARVSELDVVALKAGLEASVTLDVYGEDRPFEARITHVDPSETVENGVAGYGVTLAFRDPSADIKPGMTVNVLISITERDSALSVPSGYIRRDKGDAYVQVLRGENLSEQPVTLGTAVPGGLIEIVSGLQAGDTILPYD